VGSCLFTDSLLLLLFITSILVTFVCSSFLCYLSYTMPTKPRNRRRSTRRQQRLPQLQTVTGNGDFKIPKSVRNAIRTAATSAVARQVVSGAGTAIGARFGQPDLGRTLANKAFSRIVGSGDYDMRANSLITSAASGAVMPTFTPDGRRGIRVREREYIGDVVSGSTLVSGSTIFSNSSYTVNPSNSVTFPWLSKFAANFDQWEPHGIVFEYVSTSSAFNGSSQALGVVVTAADYDFADPLYASKAEMENSGYAISTAANTPLLHGIECAVSERPSRVLYTGDGAGSSTSSNLHNLARFQVATQGMSAAGVTLGELWVTYDITFYKKQLPVPGIGITYSEIRSSTPSTAGSSIIMGMAPSTTENGLRLTIDNTTLTDPKIVFPNNIGSGTFLFTFFYNSPAAFDHNITMMNPATSSRVSFNAAANFQLLKGDSTHRICWCCVITLTGTSAILGFGTAPPSLDGPRVITISECNPLMSVIL
jgi:hypothetical protein